MSRRRVKSARRYTILGALALVAVLLPKFIDTNATGNLGDFEVGETGIKLCAIINNGYEDSLRFRVTNDAGFASDVIVPHNSCRNIPTVAANYTIREYVSQEYVLDSVTGGTVSADNTQFAATSAGQYTVIYENTFSQKRYLHSSGNTSTSEGATVVEITYDANGGTGTMNAQRFGINAVQPLSTNGFTRTDYLFSGWNTAADGSGTAFTEGQTVGFAAGGEYTLYAQWRAAPANSFLNLMSSNVNNLGAYEIDFHKGAVESNVVATANGNGINAATENGSTIYYYRGEINDNNVIWGGFCWKIVRTTAAGGTKLIYNGEPTTVGGVQQCTATGLSTVIEVNSENTFHFGLPANTTTPLSPADVGYMYGTRIVTEELTPAATDTFVFSNNVTRSNNTYTLDTTNSISGAWQDEYINSASGFHYFCTDGSSSCDDTKIAYILSHEDSSKIFYLSVGGYDDIEGVKEAMFANTTDSVAKATIESWFEDSNLDGHVANSYNYEDDLEDAIYCNDRSVVNGSLVGKDSLALPEDDTTSPLTGLSYFGSFARNYVADNDDHYHPSLDCSNKDDAFTKSDTTNGNAKLGHMVGMLTADEVTMSGIYASTAQSTAFLNNGYFSWTMSPERLYEGNVEVFGYESYIEANNVLGNAKYTLRPVVTLKGTKTFTTGGDGTTTNPYVVQ